MSQATSQPRRTSRQPTIAQTIIASLLARGYTVVQERDRLHKYTLLHNPANVSTRWVWVGAAGAARHCNEKRVSGSRPLPDATRRILLAGRADNLNATAI